MCSVFFITSTVQVSQWTNVSMAIHNRLCKKPALHYSPCPINTASIRFSVKNVWYVKYNVRYIIHYLPTQWIFTEYHFLRRMFVFLRTLVYTVAKKIAIKMSKMLTKRQKFGNGNPFVRIISANDFEMWTSAATSLTVMERLSWISILNVLISSS